MYFNKKVQEIECLKKKVLGYMEIKNFYKVKCID